MDCTCGHTDAIHALEKDPETGKHRPGKCMAPGCLCGGFEKASIIVTVVRHLDYQDVLAPVLEEVRRAEAKHPVWPEDWSWGLSIISEEMGEAHQAAIESKFRGADPEAIRMEVEQVACTAIRFLKHFKP